MTDYYKVEDNVMTIDEFCYGIILKGGGVRHIRFELENEYEAYHHYNPVFMWFIPGVTKEKFLNDENIKNKIRCVGNESDKTDQIDQNNKNKSFTMKSLKRYKNFREELTDLESEYKKRKLDSKKTKEEEDMKNYEKRRDILIKAFQNPWQMTGKWDYRNALRLLHLGKLTNNNEACILGEKYLDWYKLNM